MMRRLTTRSTFTKDAIPNRAILQDGKLWVITSERDMLTTKKLGTIHGTRYNKIKKRTSVPLTYRNVRQLADWGFVFGKSLRDWERKERQEREIKKLKIKSIQGLRGTLYPYQSRGVEWIDECDGRALIADEMGLGKTVQALAWCQLHTTRRPILVICPSIVKINWKREAKKWLGDVRPQILDGQTPYEITGDLIIINYDILAYWVKELKAYKFTVLITDEAHFVKTNSAKRTKAFKSIAKNISNMIALTGTPIEKSPKELYNIVQALDPSIFPDPVHFDRKYCGGHVTKRGVWDTTGASNERELYQKLVSSVMIRRKKSEVDIDMPPKQVSVLPLKIDNRAVYEKAEKEFIDYVGQKFNQDLGKDDIEKELKAYAKRHEIDVGETLTRGDLNVIKNTKIEKAGSAAKFMIQMNALKQIAVDGKMAATIEWIQNFIDTGEKLVVVTLNKEPIKQIMKHFPTAARVDGSITGNKRQRAIDRFQNDDTCRLFVGNMDAMGIGITLTAASNIAILQYPWTPGKMQQAIDRVHRISQLRSVTAWCIIGEGTIEDKVIKILAEREKVIQNALDGGEYSEANVANEVLKMYKPKAA